MVFRTLCVIGTRPEAIKMASVIKQLQLMPSIEHRVCVTGQHRQMLDVTLDTFAITADYHLDVMTPNQTLTGLTTQILNKLTDVYDQYQPDLVLVHGDTTTALAAALSAYYHRIPVAHVEAGLRTGQIDSPWPEEMNRQVIGTLAKWHFAPTTQAKHNLLREGVPEETIYVTGNTVIDALYQMIHQLETQPTICQQLQQQFAFLNNHRKMILVTGHRRENFGEGFERICKALATIARLHPEVDIVYPVHLNPQVLLPVQSLLGDINNIHLLEPVDYVSCVYLMKTAYLILTDSGGIQEEAPSLGKPVLLMRDTTERPEAVDAGTVKLVGTDVEKIVSHVELLLNNKQCYHQMSIAQNPYGDGEAAARIVNIISQHYCERIYKEEGVTSS